MKIEVLSGGITLYHLYGKIYPREGEKPVSENFLLTPEEETIIKWGISLQGNYH